MYCGYCGKDLGSGLRFCAYCGKAQPLRTVASVATQPAPAPTPAAPVDVVLPDIPPLIPGHCLFCGRQNQKVRITCKACRMPLPQLEATWKVRGTRDAFARLVGGLVAFMVMVSVMWFMFVAIPSLVSQR